MRSPTRSDAMTNRRFGTTDLAIVMVLWSSMAVLLGGILSELASDTENPMAKAQSEAYALQLAEGLEATPAADSNPGRAPASMGDSSGDPSLRAGSLGKDPWGHAYQYKIFPAGVVVWSQGKNKACDSIAALERLEAGQSIADFHFGGDDVGFVKGSRKTR